MSADILAFPRAWCSQCEWVAFSSTGLYCLTFHQPVAESDAQDCEAYEPDGGD